MISRRALPKSEWESIELDYFLYSDDSHHDREAVTPSDGRIHLAFPT